MQPTKTIPDDDLPAAAAPPATDLTRRRALHVLGIAAAVVFLPRLRSSRAWADACVATHSATEGPFWVDEMLERSDIRSDPTDGSVKPGVPLQLTLRVLRAEDCAPAAGVQVDVWHADAAGDYSDEAANGTLGKKFLRGYQKTDADGIVRFTTIWPGWYRGRTIHVHIRVRAFQDASTVVDFTSQLFFPEVANDAVMAIPPYDARGQRDTTNATDDIFDSTLVVPVTGSTASGYDGNYDVAIAGLPAVTEPPCADLNACSAALTAALPDPAAATSPRSQHAAKKLAKLNSAVDAAIVHGQAAKGARAKRAFRKARKALRRLRATAFSAKTSGRLEVPLEPIQAAVAQMIAMLAD